jgi:hypothetical protein
VTHDEVADLLPAYARGALDEDAGAIDEHLRGCRECSELLAVYLDAASALGEAVSPVATPTSLRAAVLAHPEAARTIRPRWGWVRVLASRLSLWLRGWGG